MLVMSAEGAKWLLSSLGMVNLCARTAELLWIYVSSDLRSSCYREWLEICRLVDARKESGMNSGSVEANCKMVLDQKIQLNLFILRAFYLPKKDGKYLSRGKSSLPSFESLRTHKTCYPVYESCTWEYAPRTQKSQSISLFSFKHSYLNYWGFFFLFVVVCGSQLKIVFMIFLWYTDRIYIWKKTLWLNSNLYILLSENQGGSKADNEFSFRDIL